jgi:hypothetical protein
MRLTRDQIENNLEEIKSITACINAELKFIIEDGETLCEAFTPDRADDYIEALRDLTQLINKSIGEIGCPIGSLQADEP